MIKHKLYNLYCYLFNKSFLRIILNKPLFFEFKFAYQKYLGLSKEESKDFWKDYHTRGSKYSVIPKDSIFDSYKGNLNV